MARCPNCDAAVKWDDPKCGNCTAIFAGPEYSDLWARFPLGNFEEVVLSFYKHRSERQ